MITSPILQLQLLCQLLCPLPSAIWKGGLPPTAPSSAPPRQRRQALRLRRLPPTPATPARAILSARHRFQVSSHSRRTKLSPMHLMPLAPPRPAVPGRPLTHRSRRRGGPRSPQRPAAWPPSPACRRALPGLAASVWGGGFALPSLKLLPRPRKRMPAKHRSSRAAILGPSCLSPPTKAPPSASRRPHLRFAGTNTRRRQQHGQMHR